MLGRRSPFVLPAVLLAVTLGISMLVALGAATSTSASTGARRDSSAAREKTIASTTTSDFRIVVVAETRGGGGGAPSATVTVTTSKRVRGTWVQTGVHRLRGTYFWKSVTGPRAVCRLDVRTTAARAGFRPSVVVQLLISPSLGCGPASEYPLTA
jgi:hypothetical protein